MLYPIAIIIYCIVALFKIYGPLLILGGLVIYVPFILIRS